MPIPRALALTGTTFTITSQYTKASVLFSFQVVPQPIATRRVTSASVLCRKLSKRFSFHKRFSFLKSVCEYLDVTCVKIFLLHKCSI